MAKKLEEGYEKIVLMEIAPDNTPYQVVTDKWELCEYPNRYDWSRHVYNVEFSKAFNHWIRSLTGFFGDKTPYPLTTWDGKGKFWAADGVLLQDADKVKRLKQLPRHYSNDWFRNTFSAGTILGCSTCNDWFPDEPGDYCEHIWWCDICGDWSTPDERCPHPENAEEE